ncbi:MAG: hypothetical protein WDZ35_08630 [Crocinitomicaceae bacterium]
MKKTLIIILIFVASVGASQNENSTEATIFKRLELLYPNYYYFDKRFKISLPVVNIGIKYQQTYQNNWGFQSAILFDHMRSFKGADEFGDFVERNVLYPSIGSHFKFLSKNRFELMVTGDIEGRLGWITYFASSNSFETVLGEYELLDAGVNLGIYGLYQFKKRLFLSLTINHSLYFYRYDKGFDPWIDPSPLNVSRLALGVGWRLN